MNDLFSPAFQRNPYPLYEQMRRTSSVYDDGRFWMLFDYPSVKRALSDHESFSSRFGPAQWMIFLDPPQHSRLRALVSQAFTPLAIAHFELRIRQITDELLERPLARDEFDFVQDFSDPLPIRVMAELLGLPLEDALRFRRWNDVLLRMSYSLVGGSKSAEVSEEFSSATAEMDRYLTGLLRDRKESSESGLLWRLAQAEVEGERLTPQDLVSFFQLLLLAGSETTSNLLGNALLCLMDNPDELAQLRKDSSLLTMAIEEVLRYRSPLQWMFRVAKQQVELGGRTIPSGAIVLAMIGSANRDPRQFGDPERFSIHRHPNAHVAFGQGIHSCLGAALARLESKVALGTFLSVTEEFQLANSTPLEPRQGLHVHGPKSLPLRVKWR